MPVTTTTVRTDGVLSDRLERSWLWRLKLRLQFTGWLQFMPLAMLGLVVCLMAGGASLVVGGRSPVVWISFSLGAAILARSLFEIVTVKVGWHPREDLPADLRALDVFDLMRARHSCRSFQHRDLTDEHREELLEVAKRESRPEALIGESPIRLEYIKARLTVWPTLGAREFFVAIAPKAYDRLSVVDVGRSLEKVVIHATRMGVATCWIGPGADQRSVVAHLGPRFDAEQDHVICVCAIGYASSYVPLMIRGFNRLMGTRLPLSSLFFSDAACTVPLDVAAPPFNAFGRCYEACQWAPSSYNGQTTRCAALTESVGGGTRATRFDFLAAMESRYYAPVAVGIWCANWELGCEALGQRGHFAVLDAAERHVEHAPELPRYEVSWVVDDGGPSAASR